MPQRRHSMGTTALALVFGSAGPAAADAVLDGSTGSTGTFSGDFVIPAGVGERRGGNLFHSFERFSVRRGESATFTGPAGIDNVISRVTGGELSRINGSLASEIPGADFFFLNPTGVIFGPQAALDIDGSFHVSTADELRFEDGNIFSARDPSASSFTIAAPEAFGFLGADAGPITLRRAGLFLDTPDVAPFDTTISMVGGDINFEPGLLIFAPSLAIDPQDLERGNVNLVAMSSAGEVTLDGEPSVPAEGTISLLLGSVINVSSNDGGGRVRIHAGRLVLDGGAQIASDNGFSGGSRPENGMGDRSGGIEITAERVDLLERSEIFSNTFGDGDAGNIVLRVGELDLMNETRISSDTEGAGRAGDIAILDARRVRIVGDQQANGRTEISSDVTRDPAATGPAGNIFVQADRVIVRNDGTISSSSQGPGDAGSVTIDAGRVSLERGGQIASSTLGRTGSTGRGGSVTVNAREEIRITGDGPLSPVTNVPEPSGIFASSESEVGRRAGNVLVRAPVIRLADRGEISSESFNARPGGTVTVHFVDLLEINDAEITTQADFANAGDIDVAGPGLIDLKNGGEISTTVGQETGNAGNITVASDFLVLNRGFIQANASAGQGGNVEVTATRSLIQSEDSSIRAVALAELGINGTVDVAAPSEDVLQSLNTLSTAFLDISSLLADDCAARAARGEDQGGSLVRTGGEGIGPSPDAPLPGSYATRVLASTATSSRGMELRIACAGSE